MLLTFTKMHGLGNDFVVIDGVGQETGTDLFAQLLSIENKRPALAKPCTGAL